MNRFITLAFLLFTSTKIFAQVCATVERVPEIRIGFRTSGTDLTNSTTALAITNIMNPPGTNAVYTGWRGTGTGNVNTTTVANSMTYFTDNVNTQTLTAGIVNGNLKGTGATVVITLSMNNGLVFSGPNPTDFGAASTFSVLYNGTPYAVITSNSSRAPQGTASTIVYSNGASGNYSSTSNGFSPATGTAAVNGTQNFNYPSSTSGNGYLFPPTSYTVTWTVLLPASIPNSANLAIEFNPGGASAGDAADDYLIRTVSFKSCPVIFSGTLFNDADGITDDVIDGTGFNPGSVQVGLYDGSGNLVPGTATTVANDGTYSISYFPTLTNQSYSVRLIGVPAGYAYTGDRITEPISDGTPNGITSVVTIADANTNTDKTATNFGLDRPPVANPRTQIIAKPAGNTIPAGTVTQSVSGNDPEDGSMGNSNTIVITQLPTNATMYYNGLPVSLNQQIVNFNPALLSYTGIANGAVSVVFNYAFRDAATIQGASASYTVNWSGALPVTLNYFTAETRACNAAMLKWAIGEAVNFHHMELERNNGSGVFNVISVIPYQPEKLHYTYTDDQLVKGGYQYRLKMVDADGKFSYSNVAYTRINCDEAKVIVFPNPAKERITISGLSGIERLELYNSYGQLVYSGQATGTQAYADISMYNAGIYIIRVLNKQGEIVANTRIIKVL